MDDEDDDDDDDDDELELDDSRFDLFRADESEGRERTGLRGRFTSIK